MEGKTGCSVGKTGHSWQVRLDAQQVDWTLMAGKTCNEE